MGMLVLFTFFVGCTSSEVLSFDIPQGRATQTLRVFAKQANVEILFDLSSVEGVETNPVKGLIEPGAALRMMLEGTPLGVDYEHETGAYAVYLKEA